MKIKLEELDHQREAIDALLSSMPNFKSISDISYSNPILQDSGNEDKFIDIKMETGTGKTYVYTRAMYELNEHYSLYKFIIIVPNLAIKEGTKNFILSDYSKQHFAKSFANKHLKLQTIKAGDFNKKGRKLIPTAISDFCEADNNTSNIIQCLLLNDDWLTGNTKSLFKNGYDQSLFGGLNCPIESLASTRPIIIIDEPHRFSRYDEKNVFYAFSQSKKGCKVYNNIMENLKPQLIIRFGATFPTFKDYKVDKKGYVVKNKQGKPIRVDKIDYYRGAPQYDLNSLEAFNNDLVKGVSVQFPNIPNQPDKVYIVEKVTKKELILGNNKNKWTLKVGDSLNLVDNIFSNDIIYDGNKRLSNNLELNINYKLMSDLFNNNYQEILLKQAIDSHFAIEEENFNRIGNKVKTIALFFIDNIDSYRNKDGWLKRTFEKLLLSKINYLMKKYVKGDYYDYLLATKNDLNLSHGGYFAKDWGLSDDTAILDEVKDVLYKERTLTFKKTNGSWNIRRFFFSKWTLREGWDNPNVFTICKLRNSGSETSKLQEVGRGLRLPVDELGNRLQNDKWKLNFIVGSNEKDFFDRLFSEINSSSKIFLNNKVITDEMIKTICEHRKIDEETLLTSLDRQGIINRKNEFKEDGYKKLIEQYAELSDLKYDKVTCGRKDNTKIKLNVSNWEKIKDFWLKISKRYMLVFDKIDRSTIEELFEITFSNKDIFCENRLIEVVIQETEKSDFSNNPLSSSKSTKSLNISEVPDKISYPLFVKKLSKLTFMPIQIIHAKLWKALQKLYKDGLDKDKINSRLNQKSLDKIVELYQYQFAQTFSYKYNYQSLNFQANTSVLKNGSFIEEIARGYIGKNLAYNVSDRVKNDTRGLYEPPPAYDSELELSIEQKEIPLQVIVFGKLPKRSIKVPTYTGGSTTPDFIYAIEKEGKVYLTILLETKANDIRMSEKYSLEAQKKFFQNIKNVKWQLINKADELDNLLNNLIVN